MGGVQVDDVAEQHQSVDQGVVPSDDGADGQRILANAANHHLAAGFDAFGDGDFTLAGQQFDAAHFAKEHTNRVVCAAKIVLLDVAAGDGSFQRFLGLHGRRRIFAFLALDDVDAGLREHRHGILDLFGGNLVWRKRFVQVVIGDVSAFLAVLDHLLDGRAQGIEQWAVGNLFPIAPVFSRVRFLSRHSRNNPEKTKHQRKTCGRTKNTNPQPLRQAPKPAPPRTIIAEVVFPPHKIKALIPNGGL